MPEYRMRKLNGAYVVVAVGETSKSFHGMLRLNDTAAEIFKMMQKNMTEDEIAKSLEKEYEINFDQARNDVANIKKSLESMSDEISIEEALARDGVFISTTVGVSMYPLLRNRRDNVVVRPKNGRLKKYDVPLYRRGDEYVLHRIIEVKDDSYVIIGDNCILKEYGIKDSDIIGVAEGFYRRNRYVPVSSPVYRAYSRIWVKIYPIRMFYKKCKQKLYTALKRVANKS